MVNVIVSRCVGGIAYRVIEEESDGLTKLVVQQDDGLGGWDGKAHALMPRGWRPTTFAAARVSEALLSTVAPVDLDMVPVGQVLGIVGSMVTDIYRDSAKYQKEAAGWRDGKLNLEQELSKSRSMFGQQMTELIWSVFSFIREVQTGTIQLRSAEFDHVVKAFSDVVSNREEAMNASGRTGASMKPIVELIWKVASQWRP